ncbi:hypothetical protein ACP275_03G078700 [Erythranthe tilingii]
MKAVKTMADYKLKLLTKSTPELAQRLLDRRRNFNRRSPLKSWESNQATFATLCRSISRRSRFINRGQYSKAEEDCGRGKIVHYFGGKCTRSGHLHVFQHRFTSELRFHLRKDTMIIEGLVRFWGHVELVCLACRQLDVCRHKELSREDSKENVSTNIMKSRNYSTTSQHAIP